MEFGIHDYPRSTENKQLVLSSCKNIPASLLSAQHRASRQKTQLLLFPRKVTDCTPKIIAIPVVAHGSGLLLACTWELKEKAIVRG